MHIKNAYDCNITCIGNPKDTCGGEKSVDLYYITSPCNRGLCRLTLKSSF